MNELKSETFNNFNLAFEHAMDKDCMDFIQHLKVAVEDDSVID